MKISIEHYIVTNNRPAVEAMFKKRGIPPSKNLPDALQKLRAIMAKEGHNALDEIAGISTPYQQLILSTHEGVKPEAKSSACGCSGADGEKSSSCDGACKCGGKCGGKKSSFDNNDNLVFNADGGSQAPSTPAPTTPVTQKVEESITKHAPFLVVGLLLVLTTAVILKK